MFNEAPCTDSSRYGMKTFLRTSSLILLLLSPFVFSIATSPAVITHQYLVRGQVTRQSGASKKNFSIVLAGKRNAGQFERVRGYSGNSQSPVGLTDSIGAFYVNVYGNERFDSLRAMVVVPDRDSIVGQSFSINTATIFTEYGSFPYNDGSAGCNGCTTTGTTSVITGYTYNLPDQTVQIPF